MFDAPLYRLQQTFDHRLPGSDLQLKSQGASSAVDYTLGQCPT